MVAVSVVVDTTNPGPALLGLQQSLDSQTLRAADFEVIVVDASTDGTTERLRLWAGCRSNVTLLTADAGSSPAERHGLALQHVTGQHVLAVAQHRRLTPRALELLLEHARRTDADLVLGRVVSATSSGCAVLPDDADRIDASEIDATGCLSLIRRPSAGVGLGADVDSTDPADEAAIVSAVARYACGLQGGSVPSRHGDVALQAATLQWDHGTLQLAVEFRLPESTSLAPRGWLVVSNGRAEIAVPAVIMPDGSDPASGSVSAVLDPRTAEGGGALGDGLWDLGLRLAWPGREVTVPLDAGTTRSAVIAGTPYSVRSVDGFATLDAGATRGSVVGALPTSRASVAEGADGIRATLEYPDLHVHGDAILDARLLLDGFALPARLVCQDGRARLEAYIGMLAGVSRLSVVAGGGTPVPTGLRLRVDGVGGLTFEDVPPRRRATVPQPVPGPSRLTQRMRRRLPGALEPVARRLVRVPILRSTYRRLISR